MSTRASSGRAQMTSAMSVVSGAGAATLAAFALAPVGTIAVLGIGAICAGLLVVRREMDLLHPVLRGTTETLIRLRTTMRRRNTVPQLVLRAAVPLAVLLSGAAGYLLGAQGLVALAGLTALLLMAVGASVARPLLQELLATDPVDVPIRRSVRVRRILAPRPIQVVLGVGATAAAAWLLAGFGLKGVLLGAALVIITCALTIPRDRTLFFLFATVCSMVVLLHKSFSAIDVELSGGAVSLYVTSFDVMLVACYVIWAREGTLVSDVRRAFRDDRRVLLRVPLFAAVLLLPSLLAAQSLLLGASELFRMCWMYLLFAFVTIRVRTRRHVWATLAALALYACVQLVVVILQWKTGGVLGLGFLGVPKELGERVTNDGSLGRPFGTIIHPVFMGAVMGSLGTLAFGIAATLRRSLSRLAAWALVPVCVMPLYLSHTRASFVAFALVLAVQVAWALKAGWLKRRTVVRGAVLLCVLIAVMWPQVSAKLTENFGTDHYHEEIDSRLELNDVARKMISGHPVIGVGLNNFERVMGPYEQYGLIFADNPVHNLYLLYLSETGIVGFVGFAAVGVAFYALGMRLARSRDPLHAGVGLGFAGIVGFLMLEEILGFSLRQDVPLAMFWLLAGLTLSCAHQGRVAGSLPVRSSDRPVARRFARHPRGRRLADHLHKRGRLAHAAVTPVPVIVRAHTISGSVPSGRRRKIRPTARRRSTNRGARWRFATLSSMLAASVLLSLVVPQVLSAPEAPTMRLLFSATNRQTGRSGIYVVDEKDLPRLISPDDGRTYSWPSWSTDGSKIVYTVRSGAVGTPEDVEVMNVDGSTVQRVTSPGFRTAQPKMAPDGRSVIFVGLSPNFSLVALYRIDLSTLTVENLSSKTMPVASLDADPRFTDDGRIVLAGNDGTSGPIRAISADGSRRTELLNDSSYNTDPDLSPDGRLLVVASYRGKDTPGVGEIQDAQVRIPGWFLAVHDLKRGATKLLNQGLDCTTQTPDRACGPLQPSAFQPRFSPTGSSIAFVTTLDNTTSCICAVDVDGSDGRRLFTSGLLAINWFDWTDTGPSPSAPFLRIGTSVPTSRLLITAQKQDRTRIVLDASPDLSTWKEIPLPPVNNASTPTVMAPTTSTSGAKTQAARAPTVGVAWSPDRAAWSADRTRMVFTARLAIPRTQSPHPAPPAGSKRRLHFTLDQLTPVAPAVAPPTKPAEVQVFMRDSSGAVTQLTDPWSEDWRDGHVAGDLHGNTDPVFTADGSAVLYTSVSTKTGESQVMRLYLRTGEVLSLTNGSAGALQTDDDHPTGASSGAVAMSVTLGTSKEIAMVATDGRSFKRLTDDDWFDTSPRFSPDGRSIVYTSYRGAVQSKLSEQIARNGLNPGAGWVLVLLDLTDGRSRVLTAGLSGPALEPSWSPDGSRIAFISRGASSFDVWQVPAAGGKAEPVAVTPFINELHVDWK